MGRVEVLKLAAQCPVTHDSSCAEGCPLAAIRCLPDAEAYAAILRLTAGEVADVEQIHLLCTRMRHACQDG
jgi:hypothetical protein